MPPIKLQLDAAEMALVYAALDLDDRLNPSIQVQPGKPRPIGTGRVTDAELDRFVRVSEGKDIFDPVRNKILAYLASKGSGSRPFGGLPMGSPVGHASAQGALETVHGVPPVHKPDPLPPSSPSSSLPPSSPSSSSPSSPSFEINVAWFEALSDKHPWVYYIGQQKYVLMLSTTGYTAIFITRLNSEHPNLLISETDPGDAEAFKVAARAIATSAPDSGYAAPWRVFIRRLKTGFYEFNLYSYAGKNATARFKIIPDPGRHTAQHTEVYGNKQVYNEGDRIRICYAQGNAVYVENLYVFKTLEELYPKPDPKTVPLTVEWLRNLPKDYPGLYPIGDCPILVLYNEDRTKAAILLPSPDGRHLFVTEEYENDPENRLALIKEFSQAFANGRWSYANYKLPEGGYYVSRSLSNGLAIVDILENLDREQPGHAIGSLILPGNGESTTYRVANKLDDIIQKLQVTNMGNGLRFVRAGGEATTYPLPQASPAEEDGIEKQVAWQQTQDGIYSPAWIRNYVSNPTNPNVFHTALHKYLVLPLFPERGLVFFSVDDGGLVTCCIYLYNYAQEQEKRWIEHVEDWLRGRGDLGTVAEKDHYYDMSVSDRTFVFDKGKVLVTFVPFVHGHAYNIVCTIVLDDGGRLQINVIPNTPVSNYLKNMTNDVLAPGQLPPDFEVPVEERLDDLLLTNPKKLRKYLSVETNPGLVTFGTHRAVALINPAETELMVVTLNPPRGEVVFFQARCATSSLPDTIFEAIMRAAKNEDVKSITAVDPEFTNLDGSLETMKVTFPEGRDQYAFVLRKLSPIWQTYRSTQYKFPIKLRWHQNRMEEIAAVEGQDQPVKYYRIPGLERLLPVEVAEPTSEPEPPPAPEPPPPPKVDYAAKIAKALDDIGRINRGRDGPTPINLNDAKYTNFNHKGWVRAGTQPLPVWIRLEMNGGNLPSTLPTLRDVMRSTTTGTMKVGVRLGAKDADTLEFNLTGGRKVFQLTGKNFALPLTYTAASNILIAIPDGSELHDWIDRSVFGPRLEIESIQKNGSEFQLRFLVTNDHGPMEVTLVKKVCEMFGLELPSSALPGGKWTCVIDFVEGEQERLAGLLERLVAVYRAHMGEARPVVWKNPAQDDPPPPDPRPDPEPREMVVTKIYSVNLTGDVQGSNTVSLTVEALMLSDEMQALTIKKITVRGRVWSTESRDVDLGALPAVIKIKNTTAEPRGLEEFEIVFDPRASGGDPIKVNNYQFRASAVRDLTAKNFLEVAGATCAGTTWPDVFTLNLKIASDPEHHTPKILAAALTLDEEVSRTLGLEIAGPFTLHNLDLDLAVGKNLAFNIPHVGDVTLRVTSVAGDLVTITRDPLDHRMEVADHGDEKFLQLQLGGNHPVRLPLAAMAPASPRVLLKQETIPYLLKWLHLVGKPLQYPGQHTDIEVIIEDQKISFEPFKRNADGTLPHRSYTLSELEYEALVRALADQSRFRAAAGLQSTEIAIDPIQVREAHTWDLAHGSLFLLTPQTRAWMQQAFFAAARKDEVAHIPFEEDQDLVVAMEHDSGLVLELPVSWRSRQTVPFVLKPDFAYRRTADGGLIFEPTHPLFASYGSHDGAAKLQVTDLRRHDDGGHWRLYPLQLLSGRRVRPFKLTLVTSPHSPVLIGLLVIDESQILTSADEAALRREAMVELNRHYAAALKQSLQDLPPLHLRQRARHLVEADGGQAIEVTFIGQQGENKLTGKLTGFSLDRSQKKLEFATTLALTLAHEGQNGASSTEVLKLQHMVSVVPHIIPLKTLDEAKTRFFVLNTRTWEIVEKLSPAEMQAADLSEQVRMAGLPLKGEGESVDGSQEDGEGDRGDGPAIKLKVQYRHGKTITTDVDIPVIAEADRSFLIPGTTDDGRVERVRDLTRISEILKDYDLNDLFFIPVEETAFAQALIGRREEVMTFVTRSGVILQIPMKISKAHGGHYVADEEADSGYGIRGARLLIPDRQKGYGHYFHLETVAAHAKLAPGGKDPGVIELKVFGSDRVDLTLKQFGMKSFTGYPLFGFSSRQHGRRSTVNPENGRRFLRDVAAALHLHEEPSAANLGTERRPPIADDGNLFQVEEVGEDRLLLKGFTVVQTAAGGEVVRLEYFDKAEAPKEFHVVRSADDGALFYLFDPASKSYFYLVVHEDGKHWIWKRPDHIRQIYTPPLSIDFSMRTIDGEFYTSGARSLAVREETSATKDTVKNYEVTVAMGRWTGASHMAFIPDYTGDVARIRFAITVDESGNMTVKPGAIRDGEKTESFLWGDNFEVKIVEDKWTDSSGGIHRGQVHLVFKSEDGPYGWNTFANRDALVGRAEDFKVTEAHYHARRLENAKLMPGDTGFLTMRAGVKVDLTPERVAILEPLRGEPLKGMGDLWSELIKTRASQDDVPTLMLAMGALHLLAEDGSYDAGMLRSLAAFAALENPVLKRQQVLRKVKSDSAEKTTDPARLAGAELDPGPSASDFKKLLAATAGPHARIVLNSICRILPAAIVTDSRLLDLLFRMERKLRVVLPGRVVEPELSRAMDKYFQRYNEGLKIFFERSPKEILGPDIFGTLMALFLAYGYAELPSYDFNRYHLPNFFQRLPKKFFTDPELRSSCLKFFLALGIAAARAGMDIDRLYCCVLPAVIKLLGKKLESNWREFFYFKTPGEALRLLHILYDYYEFYEGARLDLSQKNIASSADLYGALIATVETLPLDIREDIETIRWDRLSSQLLAEPVVFGRAVELLRKEFPQLPQPLPMAHPAGFVRAVYSLFSFWELIFDTDGDWHDTNVIDLFDKTGRYGSAAGYYRAKQAGVLDQMSVAGFNVDYLLSGEEVASTALVAEHDPTFRWPERLKNLAQRLIGVRAQTPSQTFRFTRQEADRRRLFATINKDGAHQKAISGDKEAALAVVDTLLPILHDERIKTRDRGERRLLEEFHDLFSGLKGELTQSRVAKTSGKITARRSEKLLPEILFHNERLNCCIFKPTGEMQKEISLIWLDPKTPLLEFWVDGFDEMQAVATQYLGKNVTGDPVVFVDTFEGSQTIYGLGRNQGLQFVLNALVADAHRMCAKELFVYNCAYGKPLEFVSFVKEFSQKNGNGQLVHWRDDYDFTAVDVDDMALGESQTVKHHYTDAFGENKMLKGKVGGYAVDVEAYWQKLLAGDAQFASPAEPSVVDDAGDGERIVPDGELQVRVPMHNGIANRDNSPHPPLRLRGGNRGKGEVLGLGTSSTISGGAVMVGQTSLMPSPLVITGLAVVEDTARLVTREIPTRFAGAREHSRGQSTVQKWDDGSEAMDERAGAAAVDELLATDDLSTGGIAVIPHVSLLGSPGAARPVMRAFVRR